MLEQFLDVANGFGGEEDIAAVGADFSGNVIDHNHASLVTYSVHHFLELVFAGASFERAFHGVLRLFVGLSHLGRRGSYTVMMIRRGWALVHTTCRGRIEFVNPQTRQH